VISVVVADDQELVRAGFSLLLERVPDIEVVGEAEDGVQAIALVQQHRPDVALLDIRMPRLDGLSVARQVVDDVPETRVIMLTTFDSDDYLHDALDAGASGFLL
jgi:DNA-binding NarL/FixJ family response regulator